MTIIWSKPEDESPDELTDRRMDATNYIISLLRGPLLPNIHVLQKQGFIT